MRNLYVLATALLLVEQNICEPIKVEDLSEMCYISVSGLQKLFKYAFNCSVGEYISKRRLSMAAYELLNTDETITEISFKYRYTSPEVFSRAFKRFWGTLPKQFRKERCFSELFPKFKVDFDNYFNNGGFIMANQKKVDITEFYEELKKLGNTYVLCADICNLKQVNDLYGYTAGDIIIAEAVRRIDTKLSSEMLMFRVGRDEFAILTKYNLLIDAQNLAQKITESNGNIVVYNGNEIPLSMRIGISKMQESKLNYNEAFDKIFNTIDKVKKDKVFVGVLEEE